MGELAELGVVSKYVDDRDRDRRKGAALGAGSVGVGAGLIGGGIPGMKADRLSVDFTRKGVSPTDRVRNFVRARRAGAFGYRVNAHQTMRDFELSDQGIKRRIPYTGKPRETYSVEVRRAAERGKRAPEDTIIRHLKAGRKASYGLLAGGTALTAYGLHGRGKQRSGTVDKADSDRRDASLLVGGGTAAAGSYGGARLMERQGRKWASAAERNFDAAQRMVPELGGRRTSPGYVTIKTTKGGKSIPLKFFGRTKVPNVRAEKRIRDLDADAIRSGGYGRSHALEAGRLHGTALNQSYFGHVYGSMGQVLRRTAVPAGLAAAAVGGARLHRSEFERKKR